MPDNTWYEKYKKDVTTALTRARQAEKDDALSCTLVKMGDGTHLLCAHVSAAKVPHMVKEARSAGGKVISAGILFKGEDGTTFEVDTPNAAVTFDRPGQYRVDVDESGQTRLSVRSGSAIIAAGGGQIAVSNGEAVAIEGLDTPRYEVLPLPAGDRFDQFVESRTVRAPRGVSKDGHT